MATSWMKNAPSVEVAPISGSAPYSGADRGSFKRITNGCCNDDRRGHQTFVPRWSQRLPTPQKRFSRPKPLWLQIRRRIGMQRAPNPWAGDRKILLQVGNCSILEGWVRVPQIKIQATCDFRVAGKKPEEVSSCTRRRAVWVCRRISCPQGPIP